MEVLWRHSCFLCRFYSFFPMWLLCFKGIKRKSSRNRTPFSTKMYQYNAKGRLCKLNLIREDHSVKKAIYFCKFLNARTRLLIDIVPLFLIIAQKHDILFNIWCACLPFFRQIILSRYWHTIIHIVNQEQPLFHKRQYLRVRTQNF